MDFTRLYRGLDAVASFIGAASNVLGAGREQRLSSELTEGRSRDVLGPIEARLAGVLVAALKEAFDRDSARLDLERSHLEAERERIAAERERAEAALRLERLRQAADRELGQIRGSAVTALVVWVVSAAFLMMGGRQPGLGMPAIALVTAGWAALVGGLGASVVGYRNVNLRLAEAELQAGSQAIDLHGGASRTAMWLATAGLGFTSAGLLASLL